ncbi:MAG TPA: hypothetical protein VGO62_20715 [Myxococcota bacterium]|jgi:hypothetical protein
MDAIAKKTKSLQAIKPELKQHVDHLLDRFGAWQPETGPGTRKLSFAALRLDMPGAMAEWLAQAGQERPDANAALSDVLRFAALPGSRNTTQIALGDGRGHAMTLDGKAVAPPDVTRGHGFELLIRNVSQPQEAPFSAHAEADGSFHLVVEGKPGDIFSVAGLSASGQRCAAMLVATKNPWEVDT